MPKSKGSGGRNAVAQDLIRDNFEDLDMDPNLGGAAGDESMNNSSVLFPQIPPPLSAGLMDKAAAHCILKMNCVARTCKLSNYHSSNTEGVNSSGGIAKKNNSDKKEKLQFVESTPNTLAYFPPELLVDYGVRNISGTKRQRGGTNASRGELFGKLERQERAAHAINLVGDKVDPAAQATANANAAGGDNGSDLEEEVDEYDLDDDYGLNHTFSDDDGGGGDESDGEPTY